MWEQQLSVAEEEVQEHFPDGIDEENEEEKSSTQQEPSEDRFEEEELAEEGQKRKVRLRDFIHQRYSCFGDRYLWLQSFSVYPLTPLAKQKIIEFSGNKNGT